MCPNWVENNLKITGNSEELQRFKEFAFTKDKNIDEEKDCVLDTEKFIPYPKKFKEMDDRARRYDELKELKDKRKLTIKETKELILIELENKGGSVKDGFNSGGYGWCVSNWGCYDKKTQVLTTDGWKYFDNLKGNESFFTIDNNGFIKINKSTKYVKKRYDGKMYYIKNSRINLLITPEHQVYFRGRNRKNYRLLPIKNITNNSFHLLKSGNWKGKEKKYFKVVDKKIPINLWLEFLGYFLSEGSLSKSKCKKGGHQYYVHISQKKKESRKTMERCIKKLPYKSYFYDYTDIIINNVNLYKYLKKFGKCNEKYIPKEIKQLNKKRLKILFDALMLGDGSGEQYYTTSEKLAGDFQEISLKLGLSTNFYIDDRVGKKNSKGYNYNYKTYVIRFSKSIETLVKKPKKVRYKGYVYCVVVPNHTLFVKRNGKSCWCGNTKWGICNPELSEIKGKELFYAFDTAWSDCNPVIRKMSELFPKLKFNYKYWEAGSGFRGIFICKNNKILKDKTYEYKGFRGG